MEPNDGYKLNMQGNDEKPKKEPPPRPEPPPPRPEPPPSEPDRRKYTEDSPLPDAIEPEKDWDRE